MHYTRRRQGIFFFWLFLSALFFFVLFCVPDHAYAKSYTMPEVTIDAQAQTDGTLTVHEQRTFTFNGDFTAVWWSFSNLPNNAKLEVSGVSVTRLDGSGQPAGDPTPLPEEQFLFAWRDAGGPAREAYSVDIPRDTIYVFVTASDESLRVSLDYSVINGVQAYKDIAEVYWQYIGDQWATPSNNVTMTLSLPVPENVDVVPGENIRAWGHGPLDGTVSIKENGSVHYTTPHVNAGQYAEARVVFPVAWLTSLSAESASSNKNVTKLDTVLAEEQIWADQANQERSISLAFVIVCGVVSLLALLWAIRAYFKYGKEYEPSFKDQYWRDTPSSKDHPAVIARLWRWDKESINDFTATLIRLTHLGAIQIQKGSYEKASIFGTKTIDSYYLVRMEARAATLTNPIDIEGMSFLFDQIGGGNSSLWFETIQEYGKENPEEFLAGMRKWQGLVSAETNKREFFETKGQTLQMVMVGIGSFLIVAAILIALFLSNFIPMIFLIPVGIALFVIAKFMPRRSVEGNDIDARAKGLRNWLKDFSALDERPPGDVAVWGEFMIYAYIFGIAKQVIKELQLTMPELFSDTFSASTMVVPWWFWYSGTTSMSGAALPAGSDFLQRSLANTVQSAQASISAAQGGTSSGGGFGGGFSGGGGGGFGGGGGAR